MIRRLTTTSMRALLRRSFVVLYVLAVALGAAGFLAVTSVTQRLDTLVTNLQPLAARNAAALTDMVDAETGLRGFELTGQASFLQPYHQGIDGFPRAMDGSEALARSDPREMRLLGAEKAAALRWNVDFAEAQVAGRVGPSASVDQEGKTLFDRFRATNAAVAASVRQRITAARSGADLARNVSLGVLAALLMLTVAAGTYTGLRLLRRVVPPLEAVTAAILRLAGGESRVDVAEAGTSELVALARAVKHLDRENLRRHTQDRRRERLRILTANLAVELSEHLDIDKLLSRCASTVGTAFDVDRVLLWLSEDRAAPQLAAEWQFDTLPSVEQAAGPEPSAAALGALLGELGDRELLVCERIEESDALRVCSEALGVQTVVACRAHVSDDCVATLALLDQAPRSWEDDETAAFERLAAELARAIRRAQLFAVERRLVADLEALDRAKADFVATVSHELRTPLTSIRGYVEMLRDGTVDAESDRQRMLAIVDRNSKRLQHLVDELLTLSRIEAGTLTETSEEVPVDRILAKVAVDLGPQAAAGRVDMDLAGVASRSCVRGDAGQVEQIVVNLVSNAVKFTPEGGRVSLSSRAEGAEVVITVADTGIGIPFEDQEKVGSRFFRASNATTNAIPGTGLGIRIVRGLVSHHGGSIGLDSQPGRGTVWTVRLPLAVSPPLTVEST